MNMIPSKYEYDSKSKMNVWSIKLISTFLIYRGHEFQNISNESENVGEYISNYNADDFKVYNILFVSIICVEFDIQSLRRIFSGLVIR